MIVKGGFSTIEQVIDNKGINFYSFRKDETSHRILSLKQQLLDEEKNLVRYDIELQELRSWDKVCCKKSNTIK
jgi:hypothetical protein